MNDGLHDADRSACWPLKPMMKARPKMITEDEIKQAIEFIKKALQELDVRHPITVKFLCKQALAILKQEQCQQQMTPEIMDLMKRLYFVLGVHKAEQCADFITITSKFIKELEKQEPCPTCGDKGTIPVRKTGDGFYRYEDEPCPKCQEPEQSNFIKECRELIRTFFETDDIPHSEDCYIECNNLFVEAMEKLKEACDRLEAAEKENHSLKKAILNYGNNPAGFDWGVLGKIDQQESIITTLRNSLQRKNYTLRKKRKNAQEITKRIRELRQANADLKAENERLEDIIDKIRNWCKAYPLEVFPKPTKDNWKQAAEVLKANGLSLDRFSADNMRHVLDGINKIIDQALGT